MTRFSRHAIRFIFTAPTVTAPPDPRAPLVATIVSATLDMLRPRFFASACRPELRPPPTRRMRLSPRCSWAARTRCSSSTAAIFILAIAFDAAADAAKKARRSSRRTARARAHTLPTQPRQHTHTHTCARAARSLRDHACGGVVWRSKRPRVGMMLRSAASDMAACGRGWAHLRGANNTIAIHTLLYGRQQPWSTRLPALYK